MLITFSNTLLASSNPASARMGPAGLSWNGQPIVDVAQFFRAAQSTVFGRGDGPEDFSFSVWANFNTEAEVLSFCATHRSVLPVQATLTLVDDLATVALVMANAVREVHIAQVIGNSVRIDYKFTGAGFASDTVPADVTNNETVKAGVVTLAVDDTSKAITFDTPFASVPRFVQAQVIVPTSTDDGFSAWPIENSITAAGFTAKLGALVPATGYKLRWAALL